MPLARKFGNALATTVNAWYDGRLGRLRSPGRGQEAVALLRNELAAAPVGQKLSTTSPVPT